MNIKENVESLEQEIEAVKKEHRIEYPVTICAATKYVDASAIRQLFAAGISNMGENRADAFLEKYEKLPDLPIIWHFIGSLQTNKVKKLINKIRYLHSLDRLSLAQEINKYRTEVLDCFVEVNCSGEASKSGIFPEDVKTFIPSLEKYDKIRIIGLMTMAAHTDDEQAVSEAFKKLAQLKEEIRALNLPQAPCTELSMGMTGDFKIAIANGATIIRVGSRLFK